MIVFIHGPDRQLARDAARGIAAEHDPDGANTSWLDGREVSLNQVTAAVGTISFFGGARVVVVSDLLGRSQDPGTNEPPGRTSRGQAHPILTPLAAAVPDQHLLILVEPTLTAAPAALKTAAPESQVIAAEPPRGPTLISWIVDTASRAGTQIDQRAAQLLASTLWPQTWDRKPNNPRYDRPPDMGLLSQEIEKLALFAHPEPITTDDVRTAIQGGPDQRLFRFLDAALGGNLSTASAELERLEAAGEEPAMLLASMLGQIELSTIAAAAERRDASAVAKDIGSVAAGRMSAVLSSTRRQPHRATSPAELGVQIDRALKSGRIRRPETALRDLMLDLAAATTTRKAGRSA